MFLAAFVVVTLFPLKGAWQNLAAVHDAPTESVTQQEHVADPVDPFAGIKLEARAVYVFDMSNGTSLFARNENERLPLASVTKVMTAIVANDLIPSSTTVTIHGDDIALEGDSGLYVGERWRLSDLINFTLTTSSNDGASAIAATAGSLGQVDYGVSSEDAKSAFVAAMNAKAKSVPISDTVYFNETGLDVDDQTSGAYGTAKDMAKLFAYAVRNYPQIFTSTRHKDDSMSSLSGIAHVASNTNGITGEIPGLLASKTGYTDLAGGNLVIVFDAGIMHPIAIAVLGSTKEGRFHDMKALVDASVRKVSVE